MYKLSPSGKCIIRIADNACIPIDQRNEMYAEYLVWLAEGNTPLPYDPPVVDPKEQSRADLAATDKEMARIAEDLINVLLNKELISASDFPNSVLLKLNERANLRKLL